MKKLLLPLLLLFIYTTSHSQIIGYTMSTATVAYAANTTPTVVIAAGSDDIVSAPINIGFTFDFGCVPYTTFQVSSNGVMYLGTTGAASAAFNDLTTGDDRPIIAPLWDDLACGTGGNVNYRLSGVAGSRILTVEWKQMEWNYAASAWAIEFQVKLYEANDRIEFCYNRSAGAAGANLNSPSASIGLGGAQSGDFYSLNGASSAPTASKVTETTNISAKPVTSQVYRWDPIICSGAPAAGTAVASPSVSCSGFTTILSLTGVTNACGLTYQWTQSPTVGGIYTPILGATSSTCAATVNSTTFYRCIVTCGVSSATSTAVQTTTGTIGTAATLPYSSGAVTTCGAGNSITDANTPNICSLSDYYTGEERVYRFTPAATGQITITHNSTSYYDTGLMLYQGCPSGSSGVCVESSQYAASGTRTVCSNVTAGQTYYLVVDGWGSCNAYSLTISAPNTAISSSTCSMAYTPSAATYSFHTFTGTSLPTTDDVLFNAIINFGFPVCFDGARYFGGYVASNSAFVFSGIPCYPNIDESTLAAPGVATGFTIPAPAPVNNTSIPRNAVLAPWHDIDPASSGTVAATRIQYATFGTAPNRFVIISWENIPMYSTACETVTAQRASSQVKLYETSNDIEIHVRNKQTCTTWNEGAAVLGLLNYNGTKYIPPVNQTAHNNATLAGAWAMTNTAYKFTTVCGQSSGACLTLPIGFTSFYGERTKGVNHLYWETATESDLKLYVVQRSTDGYNFTDIGYVTPRNAPGKYTFDDTDAQVGIINYYRIEVREYSGVISYTDIYPLSSGMDELLSVSKLYPNPANNNFTIAFDSKQSGEGIINVYDVYGKLVKSQPVAIHAGVSQSTVSTEELPVGVYYVEMLNSLSETITKQKLVIQK